ncbi:Homeobox protein knotted-1-like 2 [Hibiscus syriacus]|uniref:Homeobox protein knotted-1-like 2 n=1 Tax=Hibiscus syriacus TaxID=106335 RepID=A0A6A3BJ01_HIBSY|nr:Homeobox protein knotted-1-like 2 [Hibiscus syriacus]
MDGMHGFNSTTGEYADKALMSPENLILPSDYDAWLCSSGRSPMFGFDELFSAASAISEAASITPEIRREEDISCVIKAKIVSHPYYHRLLQAYIDCQKVGATPEIASILDEILRENDVNRREIVPTCLGADPELDEFMETYCDMLVKFKSDLSRPFDEATTFLNKIEMQLRNLCTGASIRAHSDSEMTFRGFSDAMRNSCLA